MTWEYFGDEKLYFVPQAVLVFTLLLFVRKKIDKSEKIAGLFIDYFLLLAAGNIIKELFYSYKLKQINDYFWGGLVTIIFIIVLIWEIRKQHYGRN